MVNEMQFPTVAYKKKKAKNNFYFTCKTLLPTFSLMKKKLVNKEWTKKLWKGKSRKESLHIVF